MGRAKGTEVELEVEAVAVAVDVRSSAVWYKP